MCDSKLSLVLDGATDGSSVAQKIVDIFQNNCCAQPANGDSNVLMQALKVFADAKLKLLDVGTMLYMFIADKEI